MPFLPVMQLWIANEIPLEQTLPSSIGEPTPLEQGMSFDESMKIKPFVLEGSVETFDPVTRALDLSKTLPRQWCGVYRSFDKKTNIDVKLTLSNVRAIGQIVDFKGKMFLGNIHTKVYGHLNAKSDQWELLPLADKLIPGLEPGGFFVGLQGPKLLGWKSPRLDNPGGRLELNEECSRKSSKSPAIQTIW